jgi:hypothetical protein
VLKRDKYTLTYPKHWFNPEEWLTFVEGDGFLESWHNLSLSDDDLQTLQVTIMVNPKAPVIPGTGGLRKLRFGQSKRSRGKRGGARVLYVYFEEVGIVLLVAAYDKREKDNFPPKYRKAYREMIERQRQIFATRTEKDKS